MEGKAASVPLTGIAPAAAAHPRLGFSVILQFESDDFLIFLHAAASAVHVAQPLRIPRASCSPRPNGEVSYCSKGCTRRSLCERPILVRVTLGDVGTSWSPLSDLTDAGIAMVAAMILFVIPVDTQHRQFVLDWETALKLPWSILILFGGGCTCERRVRVLGESCRFC